MKVIWKYPVPEVLEKLELPKGAQVLTVQMQGQVPTLWAEVDPDPMIETEIRYFEAIGTGHKMVTDGARLDYVATVQQPPFVWHYFERVYR